MDLFEAIQTTPACRAYKTDPVPGELIARILAAARCGPTGGNRQPLSFVVVRDADKRRQLRDLYLPIWDGYVAGIKSGQTPTGLTPKLLEKVDRFAQGMAEIPVFIVVCFDTTLVGAPDKALARQSVAGGASIYPAVQNLILAARGEGLGTALTTLHCAVEPEVQKVLGLPAHIGTAAVITVGWPAEPFPKKLKRRPLAEIAFADTWGESLPEATGWD
jgi:nitroreductase